MRKKQKKIEDFTFLDHLEELRWRIIKTIIVFVILLIASLFFVPSILFLIKMPIKNLDITLNIFSFQGYFLAYLKIGFITSLILTFPVAIYQISAFVLPGLYSNEKRWFYATAFFSIILFLSGICFSYFVMTPIGFNFLYNFAIMPNGFNFFIGKETAINLLPGLNEYIDLFLLLIFLTGFAFQLPLVIMFLTKIGIIDDKILSKYRAHSFVLILIISAFLTPPDVITQLILGIPLYLLFEVSILLSKIMRKKAEIKEMKIYPK